jgi:hypothetical protein
VDVNAAPGQGRGWRARAVSQVASFHPSWFAFSCTEAVRCTPLQWVCDYACPPHGHCPFPSWAVRKSNAEHSRHSCCPYSGDTSFTLLTAHCGLLNAWSPGTCCWEMGPSRQSLGLWGPALEKTVVPLYFLILFLFLVGDMSSLLHHPLPPQCAILTVPRQMETRDFVLEPVEL